MREIIVRHSNSSHILIKESTLVNNDFKPHERYQLHAQMDHNHMLTFEIYLHRSRATHFKDQEGLLRVVMGLGSWFKETKDKESQSVLKT